MSATDDRSTLDDDVVLDTESGAAGDLDLRPRELSTGGRGRGGRSSRSSKPLVVAVVVLVVLGLGMVVAKGLTNAVTYYYNADEAVAQKDELGDKRIRVQGTVEQRGETSRRGDSSVVEFTIAFRGVEMDVVHTGDPQDLFEEPNIPVVLEGRWEGDVFASDKMLIKHSSEYKAENPDRVEKEEP